MEFLMSMLAPADQLGEAAPAEVVAAVGDDGRVHVRSAGGQGSHQLLAMANANALAVLPDGNGLAAGEAVDVLVLESP